MKALQGVRFVTEEHLFCLCGHGPVLLTQLSLCSCVPDLREVGTLQRAQLLMVVRSNPIIVVS